MHRLASLLIVAFLAIGCVTPAATPQIIIASTPAPSISVFCNPCNPNGYSGNPAATPFNEDAYDAGLREAWGRKVEQWGYDAMEQRAIEQQLEQQFDALTP